MTQKQIVVADDDASIRSLLSQLLSNEGFNVSQASTGVEVVEKVKAETPDLVIMDVRMADLDGVEALARIAESAPQTAVLTMTTFGTSGAAQRALRLGAVDTISKPFELDKIVHTVRRVLEHRELAREVQLLRHEISSLVQTERIIGSSAPIQEVRKTIGRVAKSDATVLITGESGTGKELVAEAIHYNSSRRSGPLVKVSCAALPETVIEAELFGDGRASSKGGLAAHKGRVEFADRGTLFLDEIDEISPSTQKKLVRMLQERVIERASSATVKVDIRVICATNQDLAQAVQQGKFREDLFYRLNIISFHLPPLRERREDIPLLVEHFLAKHRYSATAQPAAISAEALERIRAHDWPGNVRELENVIGRAVVLSRGQVITARELPFPELSERSIGDDAGEISAERSFFKRSVAQFERDLIMKALRDARGNRSKAAEMLGIYRRLLYAKMKEYDLESYPPRRDGRGAPKTA